jgi:hypothetical protein
MKSTTKKGNKKQVSASPVELHVEKKSPKKYYYLIGLFTFFIFANTIGNGYNLDDEIVTNGHALTSQGLSAIGEIFTSNYYSDAMGYAFGYRPIVHLSFALEHELFGEKPGVGHLINVILFVLSVVLFFKLLIKWVGEKNLLFAGIAALLFAVHPIHTEVVASLKNRDELLAFLFVIWACLSAHNYLEKGKWLSLISIILLFSLAMLSKKSVYPMAFIIPAALILLKDISLKQLIFLCVSFIIPAALIGSELEVQRMGIMIILPVFSLGLLYLIKSTYLSVESLNEQLDKLNPSILPILLVVTVSLAAGYFSSFVLLIITIPLFIWLFKINFEIGLATLIFLLIGIDFLWLPKIEFKLLLLVIGFGYCVYLFLQSRKINRFWTFIGITSVVYFLIGDFHTGSFLVMINLIIFILLLQKKVLWAMVFSVLTFIVAFFIYGTSKYPMLILLISISMLIYEKTKNKNWIQYTAVIAFSVTLGFVGYEDFKYQDRKQAVQALQTEQQEQQKFVRNQKILKEGRQLEFVENTLVAPHTTEEKIGTGFATLGTYFRLMVFPYELSFYYGFAKTDTFGLRNGWVWLFILIHLGMIFLAFFHLKKNPMITIGVFWYLLCILLFSNWIELVAGMVGERLAFTASAGFCILITGIIFWIKPSLSFKRPRIVEAILFLILVLFSLRTISRNTDWKDPLTLMGNDIKHLQNSAQANNLYAIKMMSASYEDSELTDLDRLEYRKTAVAHFKKAVEIYPKFSNAWYDLARSSLIIADSNTSINAFRQSILTNPDFPDAYFELLSLLEAKNERVEHLNLARKLYRRFNELDVFTLTARSYFANDNIDSAVIVLREGLKLYKNDPVLLNNIDVLRKKGNQDN